MKILKNLVMSNIDGNYILISKDNSFPGICKLNETGAFIFARIEKNASENEILQDLIQEYPISKEQAKKSYDAFIKSLVEAGFLSC